jgi:Galactose oxidase, central domain/Kelch motif
MNRRSRHSVATELAAGLRQRAADVGGEDDLYQRIMTVAATSPQRRRFARWSVPLRLPTTALPTRVAVAAVIGVLAVGGLLYVNRPDQSAVGDPSPTPGATSSPSNQASPSARPSASVGPRTKGTWTATGNMVTVRHDYTATLLLDGSVLVAGGLHSSESGSSVLRSAELYDPATGTWAETGAMVSERFLHTATLLPDGRVLVVGGQGPRGSDGGYLQPEVYDPGSGTWEATGAMTSPSMLHTATLLRDGRVLVAGGIVGGNDGGRAEIFDPGSGTWATTGAMVARPRFNQTATLLLDGKVLVVGGDHVASEPVLQAELYDPTTGSWATTGNSGTMPERGDVRTATLLPDGTVLVLVNYRKSSAYLYDPTTGSWSATAAPTQPSIRTATLLRDGRVLTGGLVAALYDPTSEVWTATGRQVTTWGGTSTATLLLDGRVLVTGGGSTELYDPAGVSPSTLPDPLPTSVPTPTPTPVPPMAGPVPPNARPWTVTVVNKSPLPATLFVAEEDSRGLMGRLVGSVTPNVVPPGATVDVTFLLPATSSDRVGIFANPGPNTGPLFLTTEVSLVGEIRINADGQVGYLAP